MLDGRMGMRTKLDFIKYNQVLSKGLCLTLPLFQQLIVYLSFHNSRIRDYHICKIHFFLD